MMGAVNRVRVVEADAERAEASIRAAITFGDSRSERAKNFLAIVNKDGVQRL